MFIASGSIFKSSQSPRHCNHPADKVQFYTTGRVYFDNGEYWDDLHDVQYCSVCGAEVREIIKKHNRKMEELPI